MNVTSCDDVWAVGSEGLILHRTAGQSDSQIGAWAVVNENNNGMYGALVAGAVRT